MNLGALWARLRPRPGRVLLVEFLAEQPLDQQRSEHYPFFQGWIRQTRGACRWVVLAAGKDVRPQHPYVVELPPARREPLLRAVRAFAPQTVVTNERLGDETRAAVAAAAAGARLVEPPEQYRAVPRLAGVIPDYRAERLDPEVPTADHFQQIIVEPRCLYARTITTNPFFEGIDPDRLAHPIGCSFCPQGKRQRAHLRPPDALQRVLLQVRRYHETVPDELRRRRFLLFVTPMLPRMGEFLTHLAALSLPPAEWYLTCRVDELLRMGDALRAGLPVVAAAGHRLHLWQVGLENYSEEENRRFNKGVTREQADRFIDLVDELEAAHPGAFVFRAHGGFAMIVFTPWTTVADLRANVDGLRRHRLGRDASFALTTRLMLRHGTPIAALAERDGLTLPREAKTSTPFDLYCITHWGEDELPWRFRHPEVEQVFRVVLSVSGRGRPPAPELGPAVHRAVEEGHRQYVGDPTEWFAALVDTVERRPGAPDAEILEAVVSGRVALRR
jgi:hypothetical protein